MRVLVAIPALRPRVDFVTTGSALPSFKAAVSFFDCGTGVDESTSLVVSPKVGAAARLGLPLSVTGTDIGSESSPYIKFSNNAVERGLVAALPRRFLG